MTQITYRLLHAGDIANYRRIRLECLTNYPNYFGDSYEEEVKNSTPKFVKSFLANDKDSFMFGAYSENKLIGICGFTRQERIKTRHRGDLVQVYVDPSYSGKGIGSRLVKLTIAEAFDNPAIEQILLSVVYINDKAIALYKKFNFVQYGMIENYFKQANNSWSQLFMTLTRQNYMSDQQIENSNSVPTDN